MQIQPRVAIREPLGIALRSIIQLKMRSLERFGGHGFGLLQSLGDHLGEGIRGLERGLCIRHARSSVATRTTTVARNTTPVASAIRLSPRSIEPTASVVATTRREASGHFVSVVTVRIRYVPEWYQIDFHTMKRVRRTRKRSSAARNAERIAKLQAYATAGAGAGAAIGSVIPGLGTAIGGVLGGIGGGIYGHIYGSGDYTLKSNSLINDGSFSGVKQDYTRIRGREPLGPITILAGGGEVLKTYRLNPGNQTTFPWLSHMAALYEQWIPHGIVFEFVTTASTAITTGTSVGTLTIASDYDVYDREYRNVNQMLESAYSQQSGVHNPAIHGIECDASHNPMGMYYILHDGEAVGGSLREYELGFTTIATAGGSATGEVGQLWINYDITFAKTQSPTPFGMIDRWYGSTYTSGTPLPTTLLRGLTNVAGATPGVVGTTGDVAGYVTGTAYVLPQRFALPGKVFMLCCRWNGVSTACTAPSFAIGGGQRLDNTTYNIYDAFDARFWPTAAGGIYDGTGLQEGLTLTTASVSSFVVFRVTATNKIVTVSVNAAGLPATPNQIDVVCVEIGALQTTV